MSNPIIKIEDLKKAYKTRKSLITAIENINLTINSGDIYGIIGLSGAGKSTLIRCINFLEKPTKENLIKTIMANFILEGIYFYSGFMFFYNLERNGKMPGSAQEIRYINRDENTHLWLFRNLIRELQKEEADIFTDELVNELIMMMKTGVEHEINWGNYVIGENIQGINKNLIESYIKFLGNKRLKEIGLKPIFEGYDKNPATWVDDLANANSVKTDFFEAKSTAYAKASVLVDDL